MHKDSKSQNDLRLAKDRTVDQHSDTWEMHFNLLELCLHNLTAVTMIQVLVDKPIAIWVEKRQCWLAHHFGHTV